MKRLISALAAAALALSLSAPAGAVRTSASCAILMDADSGRILYAQNIHETRLIASITKLMTALVAVERSPDLERVVTIQPEWLGSEGSSIYLKAGEQITLKGLLYGLLLQSGNDAAMAIACCVAGDEASFVELMNRKARQLGMDHSSFANASGLNHEDHYSTAYDMALLARACLANETVAGICATRSITIGSRTFANHNRLLYQYEGCVGMKTGYTQRAGRTLVSAARRDGQTLICVTLNDGNDWADHTALLVYGFSAFPREIVCRKGQPFGAVALSGSLLPRMDAVAAEEVGFPLTDGEELELEVELADVVQAPVAAGTVVGTACWKLDGQRVASVELVCAGGAGLDLYEPENWWDRLWSALRGQAEYGPSARLI